MDIADQRHAEGRDGDAEGGDHLVDEVVGGRDNAGDVLAGGVQLVVDNVGAHRAVGRRDAHFGAVVQQQNRKEQAQQHHVGADRAHINGGAEHDAEHRDHHAHPGPGDGGLLVAVLAAVPRAEDRKHDAGQHREHGHDGAELDVADQDAEHHRRDDGLAVDLLGQLVGHSGQRVQLERPVGREEVEHILEAHVVAAGRDALKVFGLVHRRQADAGDQRQHPGHRHIHKAGQGQHLPGVLVAEHGQDHHGGDQGQRHGEGVVVHRRPDLHGGALAGVVGHDGGQHVARNVKDGVAHDVDHVQDDKQHHALGLAGEPDKQHQHGDAADRKAQQHQDAQLAEPGVQLVDPDRQKRVDDAVKPAGGGQDHAGHRQRDAVALAGHVAHQAHQGIECHCGAALHLGDRNAPGGNAAVLYAVDLALAGFFLTKCHC